MHYTILRYKKLRITFQTGECILQRILEMLFHKITRQKDLSIFVGFKEQAISFMRLTVLDLLVRRDIMQAVRHPHMHRPFGWQSLPAQM